MQVNTPIPSSPDRKSARAGWSWCPAAPGVCPCRRLRRGNSYRTGRTPSARLAGLARAAKKQVPPSARAGACARGAAGHAPLRPGKAQNTLAFFGGRTPPPRLRAVGKVGCAVFEFIARPGPHPMAVYFGGSRSLTHSAQVAQVVGAVVASGQSVHVGCSVGADALVISSAIRSPSFLHVFSAFAPSGAGSCSLSAVQLVRQAAAAGALVSWLAGGPLYLPLAARLIRRSIAGLRGCSAAVFFRPGPGSLAVAARALAASLPVFAFSISAPAPVPGCAGQWVASSFMGFACWSWRPAQLSLF